MVVFEIALNITYAIFIVFIWSNSHICCMILSNGGNSWYFGYQTPFSGLESMIKSNDSANVI